MNQGKEDKAALNQAHLHHHPQDHPEVHHLPLLQAQGLVLDQEGDVIDHKINEISDGRALLLVFNNQ